MSNSIIPLAQEAVNGRARIIWQMLTASSWGKFAAHAFYTVYQNPILTTAEILTEWAGHSYAGTGGWGCYGPPPSPREKDYPNLLDPMWVRDACAQYHAYLSIFSSPGLSSHGAVVDEGSSSSIQALGTFIEGIVRTSAHFLTIKDENIKYHAFHRDGSMAEDQFEPDTLAYLIFLATDYEKASGSAKHLDEYFWKAMSATVNVLNTSLQNFDDGSALVNTPYRPSDDPCQAKFNIPVNAFIAAAMDQLVYLVEKYQPAGFDVKAIKNLAANIRKGVITRGRGVAEHPKHGWILAFETDAGVGTKPTLFMDDAGIPSLLSLPYLGFCDVRNPLYQKTRSFVLSADNEYFYKSSKGQPGSKDYYAGVGSPHTKHYGQQVDGIWPMAITMQGLTAQTAAERKLCLEMLVNASQIEGYNANYGCNWCVVNLIPNPALCEKKLHEKYPNKGYMHESFEANEPSTITRGWFAWANALAGEWIDNMVSVVGESRDRSSSP